MNDTFRKAAGRISQVAGSAHAFMGAMLLIVVWALCGPIFNFSNTWQLVINTTTTIVTFLMVFLIQNTQNRDSKAMQLKLDELIRTTRADDSFMDLEDMSDEELTELDDHFRQLHEKYAEATPKSVHKLHHKIRTARQQRTTKVSK